MAISRDQTPYTLFKTEHECISFLFKIRWPNGFTCPFCNRHQPETAPAYNVACRYCRKQTSITSQTVMHGSKNSLISWMLVAWQFCVNSQGISAREIQRLMALTSYQTAWRWLQKIRLAAAIAESDLCTGTVLIDVWPFSKIVAGNRSESEVGVALELDYPEKKGERIRLMLVEQNVAMTLPTMITNLATCGSTLIIRESERDGRPTDYNYRKPSDTHLRIIEHHIERVSSWFSSTYRKAVGHNYLQLYLGEYSFRFNTAQWAYKTDVFEHLLKGLLSTEAAYTAGNFSRQDNS